MLRRIGGAIVLVGLATVITAAIRLPSRVPPPSDQLAAHEWGTFTTVAGEDGRAIEWLPLSGPTDLPCFVEHFQNSNTLKILPTEDARLIDYETARSRLWGKVRMETPVLYFYGARETAMHVRVRFPRGLITEWYPHAKLSQLGVTATALRHPQFSSELDWSGVTLAAATTAFPTEHGKSHYYAARATDALSLRVGSQSEKFLFYRGVANFDVPLSARATDGETVELRNLGSEVIPNVVLFERRGSSLGYRIGGPLSSTITLASPSRTSTIESLHAALEKMLIDAGLYQREATAMLETWRDSWFEDGTRVFYIVPRAAVDAILPLTITPAPTEIKRVFVGRMEVVTPAVQHTVEEAIVHKNSDVLERYARFLGPITDRILENRPRAADAIRSATSAAYTSYVKRASACE